MPIFFALLGLLLQTTAPAVPLQPAPGNPVVVIETSAGSITAELFKDRAPVSVENFLRYARDGHYAGTIWHRVVSGYVIQGGGYTSELVEKGTRPPIQNEATNGLSNRRGPASTASQLYQETEESRVARETLAIQIKAADTSFLFEKGKPGKKERRDLLRFKGRRR